MAVRRLIQSFGHAFRGIAEAARSQANMRIHVLAAAVVTGAGAVLKISAIEWCLVTLACGLVLAAEAANTAIEKLADRVTRENDERIRIAKDVAAACVLLAAIAAFVVGIMVFGPRVVDLCR